MPYPQIKGGVCAPKGFLGGALSCGIKNPKDPRLDLEQRAGRLRVRADRPKSVFFQ